jgi:hypothetical protein
MITVIIRTLGRPTLINAVKSAQREFGKENVLVLFDGEDATVTLPKDTRYYVFPKTPGVYGSMLLNAGAAFTHTKYFTLLDDDDEFVEGAGPYMKLFLINNRKVDIAIPGIKFNTGMVLCDSPKKGLAVGNVACPTYKKDLISRVPFDTNLPEGGDNYHDAFHLMKCEAAGAKIAWYEKVLINVRPELAGTNGRGNL